MTAVDPATVRTVSLCAGPGGLDEAADLLGLDLGAVGIEIDPDASATAEAAGHTRIVGDVRSFDPRDFTSATGLIVTPPCPTFSPAGKRSGLDEVDWQACLDAITALGSVDCGDDCECWRESLEVVSDPRTALVVEAARWALRMPAVEWIVCEQVPAVEPIWEDLAAELYAAGWEWVQVVKLDAVAYGAGARRKRAFLMARRYAPSGVSEYPSALAQLPAPSMAQILGWPEGETVRTRGHRKANGGNVFSADGPSWCLTGKSRSWYRDSDGRQLTVEEIGALQGFRWLYPWEGRSRSSMCQQAGDVVSPLVGAAVLGTTLGVEWEDAVRARAEMLAAGPPSWDVDGSEVESLEALLTA